MITPNKKFLVAVTLVSSLSFLLFATSAFGQSEVDGQGILINKRPLKDFSQSLIDLRARGDFDLTTAFTLKAACALDKDGHLDSAKTRIVEQTGDPKILKVAGDSLLAIGDSGYLGYLKQLGANSFIIDIRQDSKTLGVSVNFDLENETRARSVVSTLNLLISLARTQKTNPNADENDKDDLLLLNGTSVRTEAKRVSILFEAPSDSIQQMIKRKLDQMAADQKPVTG